MKSVSSMMGGAAVAAAALCAGPALGQSYGYDYGHASDRGGYAQAYGSVQGYAYSGQDRSYRGHNRAPDRYAPPPRPAPYTSYNAHGVNSAHVTGYSYGYGGVGAPYATTYAYGYGHARPVYGYSGYGHYDRGGRYGYSQGHRYDERRPGYRDRHGYHDDRPPVRRDYAYDYGYDYGYRHGYDRDCWCQDVYLYDR